MLGKAGRLAYLIPPARPFVAALWGGFAGAQAAAHHGKREAPPGRFASKRFSRAARWLRTLLRPDLAEPLLRLEQIVVASFPVIDPAFARIEFDASPWGGGAVLYRQDAPEEFLEVAWDPHLAHRLGEKVGEPGGQSTWEFLVLYIVLLTWGSEFRQAGLAIAGDSTAALASAIKLRGRGGMNMISREIAWRKIRYSWRFSVGHLPAEGNDVADALSRTRAPTTSEAKKFPHETLSAARRRHPPSIDSGWQC